jgi:hypothetical protein
MKLIIHWVLAFSLIYSPLLPYRAHAQQSGGGGVQGFSPMDIFQRPIDSRNLYLGPQRVVNEYRLLGFTHLPDITHQGFQTALRSSPLVLQIAPEQIGANTDYQRLLNSDSGRSQLFRQYRGAFAALSVVTGDNLSQRTQALQQELQRQVRAEGTYSRHSLEVRAQLEQLEVNRRLLQSFPPQQRAQALNRVLEAQRLLSSPQQRARFHFTNGLSEGRVPPARASLIPRNMVNHLRGNINIRVPDPFGREVDISWPRTAHGMERMNAPEFMRSVRNGVVETGRLGLVFLVIMYGLAEFKMLTDYQSNPRRFEETLDQTMSWAMPLSVASFFVGGWATATGVDQLNVARRSMANLYQMEQQGRMFSRNPELRRQYIQGNMSAIAKSGFLQKAMSYPGLAGGFIISQLVYGWADKLESCRKVLELDSGRYTPAQQQRIEESCQRNFQEFALQLAQSPETWMQLTALLSAKALLTFGMSRAQMMRYGVAQSAQGQQALQSASPRGFAYKVRIASRGVMAPFVTTLVGVAVFVLIFEGLLWGMEWGHRRLSLHIPARRAHEDLLEILARYRAQGWNMDSLCDDRHLLQGNLMDYIRRYALFWQNTESCGPELVNAFMSNHQRANASWRQDLVSGVDEAIAQWSEFTFKATNTYQAARLLWGDVAEQVRLQRQSGQDPMIRTVYSDQTHANEALGHVNTHLFSHPLPFFRSEPHFGWSSRLNPREVDETIAYPVYDGVSTNWSDRWQQQVGVDLLEQRMTRFLDQVLPQVIDDLRVYQTSVVDSRESQQVSQILRHLTHSSKNAQEQLAQVAEGLYLISRQLEDGHQSFECRALQDNCFWVEFQKKYLDEELWQENEQGEWVFNQGRLGLAGYQTSQFRPFGVKPLGPGQGFFIRYRTRLQNNSIDTSYFDSNFSGFTDFLMKKMVCGLDPNQEASSSLIPQFIRDSRLFRPRFSPELELPRVPFVSDTDVCYDDDTHNRWRQMGPPGSPGFYNYIEEKNNPDINYGGVVEYLYEKLDEDFVNDFDGWWQEVMEPRFEELIGGIHQEFYKDDLIGDRLNQILTQGNRDNNCIENCRPFSFNNHDGLAASVKQEMDTYFTYLITPLSLELDMDLRYTTAPSSDEARTLVLAEIQSLRRQVYDLFMYLSKRELELRHPQNRALMAEIKEQIRAQQVLAEGASSVSESWLELEAVPLLMRRLFYDLGLLFKTDDQQTINRIYQTQVSLVHAQDHLSEQEKNEILAALHESFLDMLDAFFDQSNRDGKVLLDYFDWPSGNGLSPTLMVVSQSLNNIEDLLLELQQLRQLEYMQRRQ